MWKKILKDRDDKNKELEILINKTEDMIWFEELTKLREMYLTFKDKMNISQTQSKKKKKLKVKNN